MFKLLSLLLIRKILGKLVRTENKLTKYDQVSESEKYKFLYNFWESLLIFHNAFSQEIMLLLAEEY